MSRLAETTPAASWDQSPCTPQRALEDLRALIAQTVRAGIPRSVLLFHSERLPPQLCRPHHRRLIRSAFAGLSAAERARLFHLPSGRFAAVWRGDADELLCTTLGLLQHMLADSGAAAPPLLSLVALHELPGDAEALLAALGAPAIGFVPPPAPGTPLDPALLAAVERSLLRADVACFVRRRPVFRQRRGSFQLAWERRSLRLRDIAAAICPEHDLRADPWLFRRLSLMLDRRMLALLSDTAELRGAAPFALDLNVASLVSPAFLRFDAALPMTLRGEITLGLLAADLLADPAEFAFARDFVQSRGYRLLLRHANPSLLRVIDLAATRVDVAEFRWRPDLPARFDAAVLPPGPALLLTGIDSGPARDWALEHGIPLLEGPAVRAAST